FESFKTWESTISCARSTAFKAFGLIRPGSTRPLTLIPAPPPTGRVRRITGLGLLGFLLPAPEGDSRLLLRFNEWAGVDPVDEKNRLRRHRLLCGIPAQIGGRFHPDIPQGDRIIKPITPAVVLDVFPVLHLMDEQVLRN